MRRIRLVSSVLALVAVLSFVGFAPHGCSPLVPCLLGAETAAPDVSDAAPAAAAVVAESSGVTIAGALSALWTAANTEAGLALIASVVAWLLARLWTAKPKWKTYYDNYRGLIIQAVKYAEKEIPDTIENKAALRLDAALKYLSKLDEKLAAADQAALSQAVNVAHSEAETNENI